MPIAKFLTYLQESNKKVTISTGGVILKDVHILYYSLNPDNSLMIYTEGKHEIYLDLDNFKEIAFDAIVLRACSSSTIEHCLSCLEAETSYNAYFFDFQEKIIVYFYNINGSDEQARHSKVYNICELR